MSTRRPARRSYPYAIRVASSSVIVAGAALVGASCARGPAPAPAVRAPLHLASCPAEMAMVREFCMDRYEATVVEVLPDGGERPHSPYARVEGLVVRAKSEKGVFPQAYISQVQSAAACAMAGKRLCTAEEFATACSGGDPANDYPYGGHVRMPGYCNEGKGSMMVRYYGKNAMHWTYDDFNDPRLNQVSGGLAPTGAFEKCVSPFGIHDCVGNLHEWGADPPDEQGRCRFRGGFYGDAENNGPGCHYVTRAHGPKYHDYSTGFRCCEDAR